MDREYKQPREYRTLLLGFFMLVLAAPGLNMMLHVAKSAGLSGAVTIETDTSFSPEAWLDGGYQNQKEKYLNDNIGFRPDLVRLNNQLDYFLFKKLHANGVVMGKNQELFEEGYIKAYYGDKFLGDARIKDLMRKLRFVQDSMQRAGKTLLLTFIPSKGRYYPEDFPEDLKGTYTTQSNYLVMKKESEAAGVNVLDFNGWYLNKKATTPHPLFSKMGIHWTHWGADYAMDSLNHVLENLLHIHMPDIIFDSVTCTKETRGENDIERGLNLIWPITSETLCYNNIHFNDSNKTKPEVIFIGDSFFWTVLGDGIPQNCYRTFHYWNYFNEMWTPEVTAGKADLTYIRFSNWKAIVAKSDAVVLFYTEPNLARFNHDFIDEMYQEYGGK